MEYYSTRDRSLRRSGAEALLEGLAPDGGLYLPEKFPPFPLERLLSANEFAIASEILSLYFNDFSREELAHMVTAAYRERFPDGLAPLVPVGDADLLELWHGPTCAFKDIALSLLPYLLTKAAKTCENSDRLLLLTATSGDTGSAALAGFSKVPRIDTLVFYPAGGVSPLQEAQMLSYRGENARVIPIAGNFDDAQRGVKKLFHSRMPAGYRLSSANSINVGRLIPQILYYFLAYRFLLQKGRVVMGEPVNFVVPSGNFGNVLAGHLAGKMGLPIGHLIVASNRNRILTDFFSDGIYDPRREFYCTSSPSMDILQPSNLERLLALRFGTTKTAVWMNALAEKGFFSLSSDELTELQKNFSAYWTNEEETAETIRFLFEKYNYLADPHTAVAFSAFRKWKKEKKDPCPTVVLSTASPFKFPRYVLSALGDACEGDDIAALSLLQKKSGHPIPPPLAETIKKGRPIRGKVYQTEEMSAILEELWKKDN